MSVLEKREHKRTPLIYFLKIYDEAGRLFGHMVDISDGGMMIMSERPSPRTHRFKLSIENAFEPDSDQYIHFEAECRWCKSTGDKDLYDAGFLFTHASRQMQELMTMYH